MATTRQTFKGRIRIEMFSNIRPTQFRLAYRRAQEKNAKLLEATASALARMRVKNSPSVDNRGRRRYAKTMADSYEARPIGDGMTVSLRNTTLRGRVFEAGASAHPIRKGGVMVPGKPLAFRSPKPTGPLHFRPRVMHPGQRANPVMRDAIRLREREMEQVIASEIEDRLKNG